LKTPRTVSGRFHATWHSGSFFWLYVRLWFQDDGIDTMEVRP
jgi:hypothetical protein